MSWNYLNQLNGQSTNQCLGRSDAISYDGQYFAYSDVNGNINVKSVTDLSSKGSQISSSDGYGVSIAFSGDANTLAIGCPYFNSNTGRVFIYKYISNSWTLSGTINNTNGTQLFGNAISLSYDGNTIVIMPSYTNGGPCSIYIFTTSWTLSASIDQYANTTSSTVELSKNGDVVIVGLPSYGGGRIRVYKKNGTWQQYGTEIYDINSTFTLDNNYDTYGTAVSISDIGNIIAISAPSAKIIIN